MNSAFLDRAREIRANGDAVKVLKIRVAAINIEINCLYGSHFGGFRPYLEEFYTPEIVVRVSQEDIDRECLKHPEMHLPDIEINSNSVSVTYDYGCLEPFVVLNKLADAVIKFDTFLMHGAVVEKDGYAYMFTAPSGTGKTTRIQLWRERYTDSTIVNGDKPLIKVCPEGVFACGTPLCGKEGWNTNIIVPLRAIFLLERADRGEKSSIEEVSLGKAFPFLLQQTYKPEDPNLMRKTLALLQSLEGKVRVFKFKSSPSLDAVRLAYEAAKP